MAKLDITIKPLSIYQYDEITDKVDKALEKAGATDNSVRRYTITCITTLETAYPEINWHNQSMGTARYVFEQTMEATQKADEENVKNSVKSSGGSVKDGQATAKIAGKPQK